MDITPTSNIYREAQRKSKEETQEQLKEYSMTR